MGPITLFDKSFLQSLNIDESVWFNHFYLCNICPLFYIETLGDLEKEMKNGRTAEEVVGNIADKFPQSGTPNAYHESICYYNLLGHDIPDYGQILINYGRPVKENGKSGIVIEEAPEAEVFRRWQKREFLEIERLYAKEWRKQLSCIKLSELFELLNNFPYDISLAKSLEEVKEIVVKFLSSPNYVPQQLYFISKLLNIPQYKYYEILQIWQANGFKPISEHAPYVCFSLLIDLVFIISMMRGFISSERSSNRTDITYLKYLLFTNIFVSSDRLHKKLAPLFLTEKQMFIWGVDLKADLTKLNNHYLRLPDSIKEKGLHYFAPYPPKGNYLTTEIWKRYMNVKDFSDEYYYLPEQNMETISEMNRLSEAPTVKSSEIDFDINNPDFMMLKKVVDKKRGSWYILPKDIKG